MQIATPHIEQLSGEIILLGEVFDKLREIKTELADHDYILYQFKMKLHRKELLK